MVTAAAAVVAAAGPEMRNLAGERSWHAARRLTRAAWARTPPARASSSGLAAVGIGATLVTRTPMTGLTHIAATQVAAPRPARSPTTPPPPPPPPHPAPA